MTGTADKVPPSDLDAEGALLGSVLFNPQSLCLVSWLRPEEFFSEANRRIFEAALWLGAQGRLCDVVSVAGRLRDIDRLTQIGGSAYLAELSDKTPAVADIEDYAKRIRETYRVRELIRACNSTAAHAYERARLADLLSTHEEALFRLNKDDRTSRPETLGVIVRGSFARITEAARAGKEIAGTPTGFERLDSLVAGLHAAELTVIAARPGMGKTSLVLNLVRNVASLVDPDGVQSFGSIVFSLEMPKDQLALRWVCGEAQVNADKLRRPATLTNRDWTQLTTASATLFQLPILVDDTPAMSLVDITGKAMMAKAELAQGGLKLALVAVDYIQLMRGDTSAGNREQEISSISRGLKQLSKRLGVPVIALSQLNRSVETRGKSDKRPQLSDLRESGAIEQDADNIIFIYRDDYYDKDSGDKGIAELIVAKQRNGPTGMVKVKFDAAYTRFANLAYGEHEENQQ